MLNDPIDPSRQQVTTPRQPVAAEGLQGAILGATAAEMAQARFGGPTRAVSSLVTFTAIPARVLAANPRRVFWTMVNRGVANVAVDIDPGMTAATGIPLGAQGGFVQFDVQADGESVGWDVYGASEVGSVAVRVLEVMRV